MGETVAATNDPRLVEGRIRADPIAAGANAPRHVTWRDVDAGHTDVPVRRFARKPANGERERPAV